MMTQGAVSEIAEALLGRIEPVMYREVIFRLPAENTG
jgi:hypothetical protein